MKYLSNILILIMVAFPLLTHGQDYLKYSTVKTEDFSFPIFKPFSNDTLSVEKINQHLQISELEILKGHEKDNVFENVSYENQDKIGLYGGKTNIDFSIKITQIDYYQSSSMSLVVV